MSERSRRDAKKLDKLAAYKLARAGGPRTLKEDEGVLYDEVSEDQYRRIVGKRLQKDDFVVDDGVDGYNDNGMDDWDNGMDYNQDEDSEEERERKRKEKAKKSKSKPKPAPPPAPPSMSAYRPVVSAEQENDFMANLLGDVDAMVPERPKSSRLVPRKRKSSVDYHTTRPQPTYDDTSSDGFDMSFNAPSDDDLPMSPSKKTRMNATEAITPAVHKFSDLTVQASSDVDMSMDDIDMDDFMNTDDLDLEEDVKPTPLKPRVEVKQPKLFSEPPKAKDIDVKPAWLSVYEGLAIAAPDEIGAGPAARNVTAANADVLEADGSLRFFWTDYLEHNGCVYFIGKLRDRASGAWISCCITVEGIERNLYVLKREKRIEQDEDGNQYETDELSTKQDAWDDFEYIRSQFEVKKWRAKWIKRKYAFDLPDVPRGEHEYLKVIYGFDQPEIPAHAESGNIARILGTHTSAFELLVLKRKIMGPCWLQIKNPRVENKGVSWCKIEVTVTDPKDVNPFADSDDSAPKDTPPLTILSLSVRTIMNHKENGREVVCATARIWHNMVIDDPTPPENLPCTVHTFVRPLDRFPNNFEVKAKANGRGNILPMKNERMLLNNLLIAIYKADPDVIVGHEFVGTSLDVLLHRMRDLKADHWSRIGRFRRSKWPSIGRQGTNLKFMVGRMMCDLASDGAKGMIMSTTWSMTEMCKTYLGSDRQEIDPDDTANYFDSAVSGPERLLTFVRHCELDAHHHMAIAAKVQILPLTKQLTNLAGNSWNKTLNGGRAERNEYILLHEFHRLKYICPDKWGKKYSPGASKMGKDDNGEKQKDKKDTYKGGLVLPPQKGLWDKITLVMDFNSLYPSIIQEYNIDFTTIENVEIDEQGQIENPEPPSLDVPQGVLPRLIATLVNRRRQVKSLMKDRSTSHAKLLQYDIKQLALKLTANSMYGCLGFEHSRFYAKSLAALTTHMGRQILMNTAELAKSMDLDVLYGDTDSVFVNSNVTELSEALKISAMFKKAVNDRYRLLEIDLDGVFKRLLLLQKKKYAALKIEDGMRTSTEVKGLDMKRREYCALSKKVSQYVLDQILSGEEREVVLDNIHEYLRTTSTEVRAGEVALDQFIIYKRLGKNPEDYPDAKSQPHVQVALGMKAKGRTARAGDVIPYVICLGEKEETSKTVQADRAKHPDDVRRQGSTLKIDYEHYLSQQILPPIERLCEPMTSQGVQGADRSRLAECLGLDPMRYAVAVSSSAAGTNADAAFTMLDSHVSDKERFKDCAAFDVRCRGCKGSFEVVGMGEETTSFTHDGLKCSSCGHVQSVGSLVMQLESLIRAHIARFYAGWTVCDDPTCGNRTRMMRVYGRRCLREGCQGHVEFEYTDVALYNQLRYYAYLFDAEKMAKAAKSAGEQERITQLGRSNAVLLSALADCAGAHLDRCARRWVDMRDLFSFMKI